MPYQSLCRAAADKRLVVVCGAGVTAATAPASGFGSWLSLIDDALNTVCAYDPAAGGWVNAMRQVIDTASHPDDLIMVSDGVQRRLGNKFGTWLRTTVGSLEPENPELIEAIGGLCAPIATTNYDTLIEKVLNRTGVTWKEPPNMQMALTGELDTIMYLHGRWLDPDSVVFGAGSYGNIAGNESAQFIQGLIAGGRSILFVGVGDTLRDPNIGALLKRVSEVVRQSQNQHYLLCRSGQLQEMIELYKDTSIIPIAFGPDFGDLTRFLASLANDSAVRSGALCVRKHHDSARQLVLDGILNKSLIATENHRQRPDITTLLIPPILLPAPHEEIVSGLDSYEPGQLLRCDADSEATGSTALLVVGDETSGVTTALEWLTLTRTESDQSLIPVVIDYRNLTSGSRTVERLVRRTLGSGGVPVGAHERLPNVVLAVDNVTPGTKRFENLVSELREEWVEFFCLGCRRGIEQEIIEALEAAGIAAINTRYLGQVTRKDTLKLTRLAVGETRAEQLAGTIYGILESENLARTPWTIGLLLKIFVHTSITIKSISPTNLLDLFMNSLLGQGDIMEDSRISLDARGREAILGALAEAFCRKRVGALPESEVIDLFEKLLAQWGWPESPTAVLTELKARHALSSSPGDAKILVRFAQSSYLFLFAAKRASENAEFRAFLVSKPLVYSPILTHYAALVRNDTDLLREAHSLVAATGGPAQNAKIFGARQDEHPELSPAITRLIELADRSEGAKDSSELTTADGQGPMRQDKADTDGTDHVEYLIDHALSGDIEPFPVDDIDDGPDTVRAFTALNLVSNVLRDSELVPDPDLKMKTLSATLTLWAYWVSMLETDTGFTELCTRMADTISDVIQANDAKRDEFKRLTLTEMPLVVSATGMNSALASRKLDIPLQACLQQALTEQNLPLASMAALLSAGSRSPEWARNFLELAKSSSGKEAAFDVLVKIARFAYVEGALTSQQTKDIESFLTTIIMKNSNSNATLSKDKASRAVEGLRRSRALHKARSRGQIREGAAPPAGASDTNLMPVRSLD